MELTKYYNFNFKINIIYIKINKLNITHINYYKVRCVLKIYPVLSQKEHYNRKEIIYTSNNKYSYNLIRVYRNNTLTFVYLPIENNIIIPKNILVPSQPDKTFFI